MSKICKNCGSQLDDDALFCDICGANLNPQITPSDNQYNAGKTVKTKKGLIIALIIGGILTVFSIIIIVIILIPLLKPHNIPPESSTESSLSEHSELSKELSENKESGVVQDSSNDESSQGEETSPEPPDENSPQEQSSSVVSSEPEIESSLTASSLPPEESNKTESKLPYADDLGTISPTDFAWISDAMSGNLTGSFISNDDLVGKWKAEFIFDGIFELVYITIDTQGTVTIEPYQINYGDGWEDESGEDSYHFNGSFDINRVYGSGIYGKIDLNLFLETDGKQYASGTINPVNGDKADIYMVRP